MVILLLLVLLGYIFLGQFTLELIGRYTKSRFPKVLAVLVFIVIPVWDVLPGQIYHYYLCKTESGIAVHKTVLVDKSYFQGDGQLDNEKREELFIRLIKTERDYSKFFNITKDQVTIVDKESKDKLGTITDFWYYGSWLYRSILPESPSKACHENSDGFGKLWSQIVRPID